MIFWSIQDHHASRRLLTCVFCMALVIIWTANLLLVAKWLSSLFFCFWFWTCLHLRSRRPLAISFNNNHWLCHYLNGINQYQLHNGYVLGFMAQLEFRCEKQAGNNYYLWLLYWDISETAHKGAANWNQLRVLIRANRHQKPADNLSLLP